MVQALSSSSRLLRLSICVGCLFDDRAFKLFPREMDSVAGNYFDDFVNVDFSGNWLKRVSYGFRQTIPRTG